MFEVQQRIRHTRDRERERMNLHPCLLAGDRTVSLTLHHSFSTGLRPKPQQSPPSNLPFLGRRSLPLLQNRRSPPALRLGDGDNFSVEAEPPAKVLRRILESPGIHQGPACFDALSAKLIERAGFRFCFTSGI